MADYIIKVEHLGKKYRIPHLAGQHGYVALRDVIANGVRGIGAKVLGRKLAAATQDKMSNIQDLTPGMRNPQLKSEEFWALKDVSFEVKQGDVVGVIGRNGAGKSTLLKILSRITEPTEGRVRIRGRMASLLEVGTGFHPELTGRENIYLNGSILGMTRAEITRKFDEIVDFAEIGTFLDTPVKRYSSGMYVRLAFAVASQLEPEILVVDEVLAVGDADFQKKCLRKMHDVSKGGRTVLFVSHNMGTIASLCSRGILLDHGTVKVDGAVLDSVQNYLRAYTGRDSFERGISEGEKLKIVSGRLINDTSGSRVTVELRVWSKADRKVSLDLRVSEGAGMSVGFGSLGTFASADLLECRSGVTMIKVSFPTDLLANGTYALSLDATLPFREYLDRAERCLSFELERPARAGQTRVADQRWGYGSLQIPMSLEQLSAVPD
jgi:lipopolysaccharide transport system ATP-binding protein